jgi:hypothetical protein
MAGLILGVRANQGSKRVDISHLVLFIAAVLFSPYLLSLKKTSPDADLSLERFTTSTAAAFSIKGYSDSFLMPFICAGAT